MISNIKIVVKQTGQQIDYVNAEDISIKMNRVADDLTKPDSRFGEYSYTFSVPKTRNNVSIFGYAGVAHVKNIFQINPIDVEVFNNDLLILTGQLELQEITEDKFKCVFYSKLTQLSDDLKDKNLQELTVCPQIAWNYETTIRGHINSGSTAYREFEFPFIFYNTFYAPTSTFTGLTDTIVDANGTTNHAFDRERDWQNWYYYVNHSSLGENNTWYQWFPLSWRLKAIMEYMLQEVGWTMGGSFWEDNNIQQIIVPYVGDSPWDSAIYCSNGVAITGTSCGAGTLTLNTARFMPDMDCLDFMENVVKLFNLYLQIDVKNKIVVFEPYDVMFGHKINPYNINNKVIGEPVMSRVDEYNPSLDFADVQNKRILGDNRYIASSGTSAYSVKYLITQNNDVFDDIFNYRGRTTGDLKVDFGAPVVKRMRIRNEYNYSDVNKSAGDSVFFIPFISKQLPEDNGGKAFNKKDTDTTAMNNESSVQYAGKPVLLYYYGISASDIQQKTAGIGAQKDYFYINLASTNQKIPFTSPFALTSYRQVINETLQAAGANPTGSTNDYVTMLASYMQSIYLMMAMSTGLTSNVTDMSLILSDNNDFGDTIYTRYHKNKYRRYENSDILEMKIICTDVDWNALQINTPVFYDNEIYSILELKNYDVVKQTASLKLIKQYYS